jgi:hypothetical protein
MLAASPSGLNGKSTVMPRQTALSFVQRPNVIRPTCNEHEELIGQQAGRISSRIDCSAGLRNTVSTALGNAG